jgi:hypothetical protein
LRQGNITRECLRRAVVVDNRLEVALRG